MLWFQTTDSHFSKIVQSFFTKTSTNTSKRVCQRCSHVGFLEKHYPSVHCACGVEFCTMCKRPWTECGESCQKNTPNEPPAAVAVIETAKEDQEIDSKQVAIKLAQEKMSEACIHHCPSCSMAFQKWDGCNKLTCGCGVQSCYLCRACVYGYGHFCNHNLEKPCPECGLT